MMEHKKNARPDVGASERATETGATSRQATTSTHNDTTAPPEGQGFRVADFLGTGTARAIPLRDLVALTGWPERDLRRQIEQERRTGALILSDNRNGYFLASDSAEAKRFAHSMLHRSREIAKTARAIEEAAGIG